MAKYLHLRFYCFYTPRLDRQQSLQKQAKRNPQSQVRFPNKKRSHQDCVSKYKTFSFHRVLPIQLNPVVFPVDVGQPERWIDFH